MQLLLTVVGLVLLTACASGQPPVAPAPAKVAAVRSAPTAPARAQPKPSGVELECAEEQEDAILRKAASLYQEFIDRAGNDPAYAEALQRSRERIADLEEILRFRQAGRRGPECGR